MKLPASLVLVAACAAAVIGDAPRPPQRADPFVPIAVTYTLNATSRVEDDFHVIRGLGFNSIRTFVRWTEAEPERGAVRLEALSLALDAAAKADLKVLVEIDTASAPPWLLREFPDGRFQPSGSRPCLDHPGIREAATAFVKAVTENAARSAATYAIDVASNAPRGLCECRYTKKRFEEWAARYGHGDRASSRLAFAAFERTSDLTVLAGATSARGARLVTTYAAVPTALGPSSTDWAGQNDRSISAIVDRYGTAFDPGSRGGLQPSAWLAFAADAMRSAAGDKWTLVENTTSADVTMSAADLRLRAWTAISRGARGVTFPEWRALGPPGGGIDNRARAAGAFASVITHNPALFAPLRPSPPAAAIVYNVHSPGAAAETTRLYRTFFDRNVPVDLIGIDDVSDAQERYRAIVSRRDQASTVALTTAGVGPVIRVEAARATVEMRVLESPDVIALIGLNHSTNAERVTLHFPPDTQEAIWQNMETGTAVNFVAAQDGPTYTHLFQPKDTLVLIIRKGIR
jgi:hypothetical protein